MIKLIPKIEDKTQTKTWRPFTLLNLSYKILGRRIVSLFNKVAYVTKTSFIKGKYILENLITSWEDLNWAKDDGQMASMVILDFDNAYDIVEWSFWECLRVLVSLPHFFLKVLT